MLSALGGISAFRGHGSWCFTCPWSPAGATVLPWNAVVLAFGMSAAIGVLFSIYPARRASQLDSTVALRHE